MSKKESIGNIVAVTTGLVWEATVETQLSHPLDRKVEFIHVSCDNSACKRYAFAFFLTDIGSDDIWLSTGLYHISKSEGKNECDQQVCTIDLRTLKLMTEMATQALGK